VYGVLAPYMLAATASTPLLKGQFVDSDVRWNVICDSTDSNMVVFHDHPDLKNINTKNQKLNRKR